jgi:predicted DNA-binding transcriptional regulator YafY
MTTAAATAQKREIPKALRHFDPAVHTNEMFSMYGGQRHRVSISFANSLSTVVIDRFGVGISLVPDGEHRFTVTVDVLVSPTFLGWIFGFGADAVIRSPESVARQLADTARDIAALYGSATADSVD